jgi:nicotinamidase-related amidase
VLKPGQSAFFATPLALLLEHLQVRRLLLCGVAGDQCVLVTAAEARMRDYEVVVPRDCVASLSSERHERSLRHFEEVIGVDTRASTEQALAAKAAD